MLHSAAANKARIIHQLVPSGAFKKVARDPVEVGGAFAVKVPRNEFVYPLIKHSNILALGNVFFINSLLAGTKTPNLESRS